MILRKVKVLYLRDGKNNDVFENALADLIQDGYEIKEVTAMYPKQIVDYATDSGGPVVYILTKTEIDR